jgi:hypothetical protein
MNNENFLNTKADHVTIERLIMTEVKFERTRNDSEAIQQSCRTRSNIYGVIESIIKL